MQIDVPVGSTAAAYVPAKDIKSVMESGKEIRNTTGVTFLRMENGYAVFTTGSGHYKFEALL